MKIRNILYLFIILGILLSLSFVSAKIEPDIDKDGLSDYEESKVYFSNPMSNDSDNDGYIDGLEIFYGYSPTKFQPQRLDKLTLSIPYINESPDGSWTGPWKNGCEEASIAMIEDFYLGKKEVSTQDAMTFMNMLFEKQNQIWGSNADADTYRTARIINDYTSYNATIIDNPTIEQIKDELNQKRPVISFHYGKVLNNPNIPFLATGSYYHVFIIIGYDDTTNEFITHDTGDIKTGANHRYDYDIFMNSLADFNFDVHQANGPARVIFTYPKLAKTIDSPKVYYLHENIKQWIINEETFNAKKFNWDAIMVVREVWLNQFIEEIEIRL